MTADIRYIVLVWVALLLSPLTAHRSSLSAQSYAGVSLAGHVPMVQDNSDLARSKVAFGGEAGGVYEWHDGLFMLQTGFSFALLCPSMSVKDMQLEQEMLDTRGVPFIYRGALQGRTDYMTIGQLNVPFYAGVSLQGWHLMAGLKLAVVLHSQAHVNARLQTVVDYEGRYYDYLENMPNHGYHDFEPVRSTHRVPLNPVDIRLCAETGYTFALSPYSTLPSPLLRFGIFAEYGLMDMRKPRLGADASPMVAPDYTHYMSISMTHLYAAENSSNLHAHMLSFGLRITLLFQLPGSDRRSCQCYGTWR